MFNGCGKPWRGEWTMMLLTDQTQEIPPFLLRNPDGSFKHPDVAFAITAAVSAPLEVDALAEALEISRRRDDAVRRLLLMRDETLSKEQKFEQEQKRADKRAIKKAEQQRLLTNKLKQREVFAQHFKWDHEK